MKTSEYSLATTNSTPSASILGFLTYQAHVRCGKLLLYISRNTALTTTSRVILRHTTDNSDTGTNAASDSLPPPLPNEVGDAALHRSHRPSFDELRSAARSGPEECIAALRRLYHENHRASHASIHTEATAPRESRLRSALHDVFGIQTRPPNRETTEDGATRALSIPSRTVQSQFVSNGVRISRTS